MSRECKNILVGCEYSGKVRDAFKKLGHNAVSCDLLPSDTPGEHYQGDIFDIANDPKWDIIILHPPCTYLCNSGVRWLYSKKTGQFNMERYNNMIEAGIFFRKLKELNCEKICIENPIPHKYAKAFMGDYTQIVQPWQYGHGETKATCLYLKGLPPLEPTKIVDGRFGRMHKLGPSEDRWKIRSTTYQGIADAMAEQWGSL